MSRDDLRLPTWRYAWLLEISGLTVRYYAGQAPPTRSIGWGGVDYTDLPLITGVGSQTSRLTALGGVAEMGSITVTLTGQRGATGDHDPVTLLLRNGRRDSTRVARLAASLPHDTPAVDVTLDRDVTGWPTVGGREIFHLGVETLVAQGGTAAGPPRFIAADRAQLDTRVDVHLYDATLALQPWVTSDVVTWTGRRVRLLRAAITGAALTDADYEEVLRGELDRPPQEAAEGSVDLILAPLTVALKKRIGGDATRTRLVRTHHLYTRGLRSTVAHTQIFAEGDMLRAANPAPGDGMAAGSITVDSNATMKDNTDTSLDDGHPRRSAFKVTNASATPMEAQGAGAFALATSIAVDPLDPDAATNGGGQVVNIDLWDVKAVDLCGGAGEALLAWPQGVAAVVNAAWMPATTAGAGGAWADVRLILEGDEPRIEAVRNGQHVVGPLHLEFRSDWAEPGFADSDYFQGQGYLRHRGEVTAYGLDLADPDEPNWPDVKTEDGRGYQRWVRSLRVMRSRGAGNGVHRWPIRGLGLAYCEAGERHFLAESDILATLSGAKWVAVRWTDARGEEHTQVLPVTAVAEELDGGGNHVGWRYTIAESVRQQMQSWGDWPGRAPAEIRAACRWSQADAATVLLEMLLSGRGNSVNSAGYDRQPVGANLNEDDVWVDTFLSARNVGPWTLTLSEDTTVAEFVTPILQAMGYCLAVKLNPELGRQQLALVPLGLEYAPDSVGTIRTADVSGGIKTPVEAAITTRYKLEAGYDEKTGEALVKPTYVDADALGDAGGASGGTLELKLRGLELPPSMDAVIWGVGLVGDLRARYGRPRKLTRLRTHHGISGAFALGDVVTLDLPRVSGAARVTEVVTDWDRASATVALTRYGVTGAGWAPALRVSSVVDATTVVVERNRHTLAEHPVTGADQQDLDYWTDGAPCACVPRGNWAGRTLTTISSINRTTRRVVFAGAHGLAAGDTVRPKAYDSSSAAQKLYVYVADRDGTLGAGGDEGKDWM